MLLLFSSRVGIPPTGDSGYSLGQYMQRESRMPASYIAFAKLLQLVEVVVYFFVPLWPQCRTCPGRFECEMYGSFHRPAVH